MRTKKVESIKAKQTQSLAELLNQRSFKGELDLSRVAMETKEKEGMPRLPPKSPQKLPPKSKNFCLS